MLTLPTLLERAATIGRGLNAAETARFALHQVGNGGCIFEIGVPIQGDGQLVPAINETLLDMRHRFPSEAVTSSTSRGGR